MNIPERIITIFTTGLRWRDTGQQIFDRNPWEIVGHLKTELNLVECPSEIIYLINIWYFLSKYRHNIYRVLGAETHDTQRLCRGYAIRPGVKGVTRGRLSLNRAITTHPPPPPPTPLKFWLFTKKNSHYISSIYFLCNRKNTFEPYLIYISTTNYLKTQLCRWNYLLALLNVSGFIDVC